MVPLTTLLQVATEYGAVASRGAGASSGTSESFGATLAGAIDALPVPPWGLGLLGFALWLGLRRRERGGGLMLGAVMIAAIVGALVYLIARSQYLL
jgi:hypothetical protein